MYGRDSPCPTSTTKARNQRFRAFVVLCLVTQAQAAVIAAAVA